MEINRNDNYSTSSEAGSGVVPDEFAQLLADVEASEGEQSDAIEIQSDEQLINELSGIENKSQGQSDDPANTETSVEGSNEDETEEGAEGDSSSSEEDENDDDELFVKKAEKKPFDYSQINESTFQTIIGKRLGMDLSTPKGLQSLAKAIDKFRNDSQILPKVSTELNAFKDFYRQTDPRLIQALAMSARGEDWLPAIQSMPEPINFDFDFSTSDESKKLKLVSKYTGQEFEKLQDVPERLLVSVENIFNMEKKAHIEAQNGFKEKANLFKQDFAKSIDDSVNAFVDEYKEQINATVARKVSVMLKDGSFRDLFYDKEGRVKKEAVKRLGFALYGERLIDGKAKRIASMTRSEVVANEVKQKSKAPVRRKVTQRDTFDAGTAQELQRLAHISQSVTERRSKY